MSNYVNNLNELINTKKELKDIIIESTGENPSEVFSYYPSYIRNAIASSSASEEAVNSYISAYLSAYNYIDQDTLSSNSYLTQHQDLSSYATKSYVVDYVATYAPTPDLSSYVTKTELSSCAYITMDDVSACGYITINDVPSTDLSGYVSKTELSAQSYLTSHQDLSGYVSKTELSSCGYITINDVPSTDLSGYVSKTELSAQSYLTSIPSEYITQTELSSCGYITANDVDLSDYVSYDYADENYVSYSYLGDIEEITEYILGSGSSSAPENIYATKAELNSYVSKTSLQSMSYITMDDIDACGYITASDIPSVVVPVIDENIIPKETNTYTLGNSTYFYNTTYSSALYLTTNNVLYNAASSQVNLDLGSKRFVFNNASLFASAGIALGKSDRYWSSTYTANLYAENVSYTSDKTSIKMNDRNIDFYANNKKMINLSDYNGFIPTQTNVNLGSSSNKWSSTYSYNYYFGYNTAFSSDSDYGVQLTINGNKNYQWNMYQFTMTNNNYRNQCSLGTFGNQWAYTYTNNLILNGVNATEVFPSYAYINNVLGDIETLLSNI